MLRGDLGESTDSNADRMDRPAAKDRHDPVAGLLERQATLDGHAIQGGQLDGVRHSEEVRGVQEVEMQGVALDPLPAVEQPAKGADGRFDRDPGQVFEGVDGGHLVGHRADPADARDDVEHLVRRPSDDQLLEVARCLEDGQVRLDDATVLDDQPERALALDAGDPGDLVPEFTGGVIRPVHQASSPFPLATGGPPRLSMTSRNGLA